ncbi:MAG: hypothetical protein AAFP19_23400 [Bacteroidota bacterium]
MKYLLLPLCCILMLACNQQNDSATATANNAAIGFTDFEISSYPNSPIQKATKKAESGVEVEEGTVLNGQKNGAWITYHAKDGRVKTVTNYIDGKKDGLHVELNDRGQVILQCHYKNDIFHGTWAAYRFGTRKEKEVQYNMGQIDGFYREYHSSNGKLMKDIQYQNGKMHGYFKQYDDNENLLMEYVYENGEKVSGGMVK